MTTCYLQTAGYVTKGTVDVAKAFKAQILTYYHNFHIIPKRDSLPSSPSGLQLTNSSYLSCVLAFPPIFDQSIFQPWCERYVTLITPTESYSTLLQLLHLHNSITQGHSLNILTKINMLALHHQCNTAKLYLWIQCVHIDHISTEVLLLCQPLWWRVIILLRYVTINPLY